MGHESFTRGKTMQAGLAVCAAALLCLALAPAALAGPPNHPRNAALDLVGAAPDPGPSHPAQPFNHACGAAVDSKGDVYVASAGNGVIDVFDPAHEYLTSVADSHEPCGLAVDSHGVLFVSEQGTGEVVRYLPDAYPFAGTPTYSAREAIDAGPNAKGISVDASVQVNAGEAIADDSLYIAEGNRIDAYSDERQRIQVNATGGTYKLKFEGEETAPLPFSATHAEVQAALEALPAIGEGNVSVTTGAFQATDHLIVFVGALSLTDVGPLELDASGLTGGGFSVSFEHVQGGLIANLGEGDLGEATGIAAYTYRAGTTVDRYLFAADKATDEVKVFSGPTVAGLKLRQTIKGPKAGEDFGFGVQPAVGLDPTSGHFFVYDDAHSAVDEFEASGHFLDQVTSPSFADAQPTAIAAFPQRNEIQEVSVNATSGTFKLTFEGQETAPIPYNASAAEVQAALEALAAIGVGNVVVQGGYSGSSGRYHVAFAASLAATDVPRLGADSAGLSGGQHTASAETETEGIGPGALYVSTGAAAGAKLLAFGPLAAPGRAQLPELSHVLATAKAVATDPAGDVYAAAGSKIHVYGPDGEEIAVGPAGNGIPTAEEPHDLVVDSSGKLYMLGETQTATERVQYYTPSAYPPHAGTQYSGPITVVTRSSFEKPPVLMTEIAIDPANDHLFVGSYSSQIVELGPAAEGSPILNPCFACGLSLGLVEGLDVYGANGDVYVSRNARPVIVIDPAGTEILHRIGGGGSPAGPLNGNAKIAVDQSDGHVLVFGEGRAAIEEFEAAGAFVARFGKFTEVSRPSGIAIDNSGGKSEGNAYVAFDNAGKGTFDLTAFGPLSYGEAPAAATGIASGLGAGAATLNGSVDPRGFELEACHFQYTDEESFEEEGFEGAEDEQCAESLAAIGHGTGAVPVHADVSGLDPEGRYRFRLLAKNKYGEGEGEARLFGPILLTTEAARPVLYDEATLRAQIDPSGLATKYHFEYGTAEGEYGQSTPVEELAPGDGAVAIEVPLTGLAEGTEYHFRIVAENEAMTVAGPDQALVTLERAPAQACANAEYHTGFSANLPDCRAYELVTPNQAGPGVEGSGSAGEEFNNWLVGPRGAGAGESLAYFSAAVPGFDGSGGRDGFRAQRGAGPHPAGGWTSELYSPSWVQGGGGQHGVASDQRYWFWRIHNNEFVEGGYPTGEYLRTPSGFEPIGQGDLGVDLEAQGRFLSAGGSHVVFFSKAHLEPEAAPKGTRTVYSRAAGSAGAEVLSVPPAGASGETKEEFETENAEYVGVNESGSAADGSAVAFGVGGTLYLHREGATTEIAAGPNSFAGISADGRRVFFTDAAISGTETPPAGLFACDVEAGPCAGPGAHSPTEIAPESIFVDVSPDGSHVAFTSEEALTGGEENEAGEVAEAGQHNLYAWDGAGTRFVAILDPQDLVSFEGNTFTNLTRWTRALSAGVDIGRQHSPTRATPDGGVFVFQSHARLSAYDNEGQGEIYRYEPAAAPGGRLLCVSCDPSGAPPSADSLLQVFSEGATKGSTLIPNLTDDGEAVFFQSTDRLLPEDANSAQDVYEWKAQGAPGCKRPGGCLALISTGQGEKPSYLYGMSADGRDVFFETWEKLAGADIPDFPSLYDARVGGGIPDPPAPAPCQGDACQGQGSIPPTLPSPASTGSGDGNLGKRGPARCAKPKHRVKGRCVKRHAKKRQKHRAGHHRRASR